MSLSTSAVWLEVTRGNGPLILSIPHRHPLPDEIAATLVSPWLACKDPDWWVHSLYDFASARDVTIVRTTLSRTAIDVNRDPSGAPLYPGRVTTELCPTITFDGDPLYPDNATPEPDEIARRRRCYFDPYHATLAAEIQRARTAHGAVVLYEAHSIRSRVRRLFDGRLSQLNVGTNSGTTCASSLTHSIESICASSLFHHATDARFKGGYTVRDHGKPQEGIYAVQMEIAFRAYLREPSWELTAENWPPPYDPQYAAALRATLAHVFDVCTDFGTAQPTPSRSS